MNRREVLIKIGSLLLLVPASRVLVGCDNGNDNGLYDGGGAGVGGSDGGANALTFTSSSAQSHTHTFTVRMSEITNPPSGGITRDTSITAGHLHSVSLSEADLNAIDAGQTVTKETSVVFGHSHSIEFKTA